MMETRYDLGNLIARPSRSYSPFSSRAWSLSSCMSGPLPLWLIPVRALTLRTRTLLRMGHMRKPLMAALIALQFFWHRALTSISESLLLIIIMVQHFFQALHPAPRPTARSRSKAQFPSGSCFGSTPVLIHPAISSKLSWFFRSLRLHPPVKSCVRYWVIPLYRFQAVALPSRPIP